MFDSDIFYIREKITGFSMIMKKNVMKVIKIAYRDDSFWKINGIFSLSRKKFNNTRDESWTLKYFCDFTVISKNSIYEVSKLWKDEFQ